MDAETVRQMVRERELDPVVRQNQYDLRDEYRRALGLYIDTPLGQAMEPGGPEADADHERPTEKLHGRAAKKPADPPPTKWPTAFAEQTVHNPRRSRKRKTVNEAFAKALAHLGEPAGNA
jgi:hypothetical protein